MSLAGWAAHYSIRAQGVNTCATARLAFDLQQRTLKEPPSVAMAVRPTHWVVAWQQDWHNQEQQPAQNLPDLTPQVSSYKMRLKH